MLFRSRNGKIAYFGFAEYPFIKFINNEPVVLHDGACAYWKSSVQISALGDFVSNSRYASETLQTFFEEAAGVVDCNYKFC